MQTTPTSSATNDRVFNLFTNSHGSYDHDWDDFLDFSVAKGLQTSSNDYTYGGPIDREHILPLNAMTEEEQMTAKEALLQRILQDERIYTPKMWIGTSKHYNYSLPCEIKRSRKYKGKAMLINIVSKRDRYNREIYKAFIVGADSLKYYVSPGCVEPNREIIGKIIRNLPLSNLTGFLDELIHGHWNFHPYNRHLFRLPDILEVNRMTVTIDIKNLQWAWKVNLENSEVDI